MHHCVSSATWDTTTSSKRDWIDRGWCEEIYSEIWQYSQNLVLVRKRSGRANQPRFDAENADFAIPAEKISQMGPELYRILLTDARLEHLDRFVDKYIHPESTVRLFQKEFSLSKILYSKWKDGVRFFPYIKYAISSGKKSDWYVSDVLLVLPRMVDKEILEIADKRSSYKAQLF